MEEDNGGEFTHDEKSCVSHPVMTKAPIPPSRTAVALDLVHSHVHKEQTQSNDEDGIELEPPIFLNEYDYRGRNSPRVTESYRKQYRSWRRGSFYGAVGEIEEELVDEPPLNMSPNSKIMMNRRLSEDLIFKLPLEAFDQIVSCHPSGCLSLSDTALDLRRRSLAARNRRRQQLLQQQLQQQEQEQQQHQLHRVASLPSQLRKGRSATGSEDTRSPGSPLLNLIIDEGESESGSGSYSGSGSGSHRGSGSVGGSRWGGGSEGLPSPGRHRGHGWNDGGGAWGSPRGTSLSDEGFRDVIPPEERHPGGRRGSLREQGQNQSQSQIAGDSHVPALAHVQGKGHGRGQARLPVRKLSWGGPPSPKSATPPLPKHWPLSPRHPVSPRHGLRAKINSPGGSRSPASASASCSPAAAGSGTGDGGGSGSSKVAELKRKLREFGMVEFGSEHGAAAGGRDRASSDPEISKYGKQQQRSKLRFRKQKSFGERFDPGAAGAGGGAERGSGDGVGGVGEFSLYDYLRTELVGAQTLQTANPDNFRTVQNFFYVPVHLERLMAFGFFVCLDTYLHVLAFLPLRCLVALAHLAVALAPVPRWKWRGVFHRTHLHDLVRGFTLMCCCCALEYIQISRIYHYIRGQALIKLYVLIAMMEICDKLWCALGQDVMDALYFSTRFQPDHRLRMLVNCSVYLIYALAHALMLFCHTVTLNVAVNSANSSLLTLLISNNFAEIKAAVFKKFEEQNLFQLSCSDITERFKLCLFLFLILLELLASSGPSASGSHDGSWVAATTVAMVLGAEMVADWVKHSFISKFNRMDNDVYRKYAAVLRRDITACRKDNDMLDHTHAVARRLGLSSLPLVCVTIRVLSIAWSALGLTAWSRPGVLLLLVVFANLFALKVLLGLLLLKHATSCDRRSKGKRGGRGNQSAQQQLEELLQEFESIDRYSTFRGRVVS